MIKRLLVSTILLSSFVLSGQNEVAEELLENIHLHLNKTIFLQGERLWFKAYVQDQKTQTPSLTTSNLHVGIYAQDGSEIQRKLLNVRKGISHGNFAIDSTFIEAEYTVIAWTNYMQNFQELEPYQQKIKVVREKPERTPEQKGALRISLFPEGGQLIVGAYNQIGILVENAAAKGVSITGLDLVDNTGDVIQRNITTNSFGMGKTRFFVEPGKYYQLQKKDGDEIIAKEKLPEGVTGQFGITIDNKENDRVLFKMIGAEDAFDAEDGTTYMLAVYQDDYIGLEDFEVDKDKSIIWFDRGQMPYGVLTAVLFDTKLEPIAHRMFFNHSINNPAVSDLEIEHCLTASGDSLQLNILLPKDTKQIANLSLSALPGTTTAYESGNSIISSFLLQPYVKGKFQDRYFFEAQDRQKRFELDKRLLIEGWGKYDWDSRKLEKVRLEFEMEEGVDVSGKIYNKEVRPDARVVFRTDLSGTMGFLELERDQSFKGSAALFNGDSLGVSLAGKAGKLRKPIAQVNIGDLQQMRSKVNTWRINTSLNQEIGIGELQFLDQPLNISERTIALDEVTVSGKRQSSNTFQISALVEGRLIGDEEIKYYPTVVGYLGRLGFMVSFQNGGWQLKGMRRGASGLQPTVPVFMEGAVVDASQLVGMPLRDVKTIAFSKAGIGSFVSITLNTNYIPLHQRNQFVKFAIEKGYARPQEYFSPDYPDYTSPVFQNFGALDWKANINVGDEFPTLVTVPLKEQEQIRLFIEGMTANGTLIAEDHLINLTQ
ncbi:MAG: hypothetical protein AAF717_19925 [Bacteroidota bacterium]